MAIIIKTIKDKAPASFNTENLEAYAKSAFERAVACMPIRLRSDICALQNSMSIEEIRLRAGRNVYLTVNNGEEIKNTELNFALSSDELSEILCRMCDSSMYAYSESIVKGYISLGEGVRVGVCGRASVEGEKIFGVCNISALNIRLPCFKARIDKNFVLKVKEQILGGNGVLIYSPPAGGKTTVLRALSLALSGGTNPLRIAVVDTREEIITSLGERGHSLDVLSCYPHAEGIRIATEYMNPQVVICDEIGSEEDALAIVQSQNRGVPLIATAHGTEIGGLMRRQGILALHKAGVFGQYVFIHKRGYGGFEYELCMREEVEDEYFRSNTFDARRGGSNTLYLGA